MKKKAVKIIAVLAALTMIASAVLLTGCGSESKEAENELVIGMQPSGAFILLIIAREKGYVEDALAEYDITVKWEDFEAGPPINEAMASGDVDAGALGDVPAVSAIAAGQDNCLAFMTADGSRAYAILVAADSDITELSQLKGKTVATVVGSTGHNLLSKALKKEGLSIDDDVELVNIEAGDAATVLSNGEADAVAIWEPSVTRLTENGVAKVLAYGKDVDLLGPNQVMFNAEYAEANPEVVEALKEACEKGIQDLENLDEETLTAVGEYLSLDNDQVLTVAGNWDYKTDVSDEDIAALNDTIDFLVQIGSLEKSFDISDYVYGE